MTTGLRMGRRRLLGPRRFAGDAAAICRSVVGACWNERFFAASGGHFRQFWTRDLAFSAAALARMGEGERLLASLDYGLRTWRRTGAVTTTIFPGRRPVDVYTTGIDSLPLLLHALRAADAGRLVAAHADWLGPAIARWPSQVLDPRTGLVRDDRAFATHRDVVVTRSNATANTMVALLSDVLRETGWFPDPVPAGSVDRLVARFWRGGVFVDDPVTGLVAGDATLFPFWLRVVPDDLGLAGALERLRAEGLADPLPLRYVARRDPSVEDPHVSWFLPDYQGTTIWSSLGAMYVELLGRVDRAAGATALGKWTRRIEADGTVWEVLDDSLRPYAGRLGLFRADEAMLWGSLFLDLLRRDRSTGIAGGTP
ncbi:MAG TPA: hypothetical protein VM344_05290 [Vitreimonas sp.]|nr:hypothetical protein [Vitreimonas sp.]